MQFTAEQGYNLYKIYSRQLNIQSHDEQWGYEPEGMVGHSK